VTGGELAAAAERNATAAIVNVELFLFNGHFGRLNYRKNIITLFKIHSLD
jgi:hypothetical protein